MRVSNVKSWNSKSTVEANGLPKSITSQDSIAVFHNNLHFLAYTKPLSIKLQAASKEILEAYQKVVEVKKILAEERAAENGENSKNSWHSC